ncbi:hypothetical protein B0T25DRAFT_565981 [Lasiosphaeria hispida]|uniref:Uncharacterized protein n=1 Tax=Lasiosphaeria hispida TaxID=260671 RepID=A0AAJ0HKM1_9PEZI|nr:hypothetical protein B0T25DRAFT_565981 [Lasiosphaeria hispida]
MTVGTGRGMLGSVGLTGTVGSGGTGTLGSTLERGETTLDSSELTAEAMLETAGGNPGAVVAAGGEILGGVRLAGMLGSDGTGTLGRGATTLDTSELIADAMLEIALGTPDAAVGRTLGNVKLGGTTDTGTVILVGRGTTPDSSEETIEVMLEIGIGAMAVAVAGGGEILGSVKLGALGRDVGILGMVGKAVGRSELITETMLETEPGL